MMPNEVAAAIQECCEGFKDPAFQAEARKRLQEEKAAFKAEEEALRPSQEKLWETYDI